MIYGEKGGKGWGGSGADEGRLQPCRGDGGDKRPSLQRTRMRHRRACVDEDLTLVRRLTRAFAWSVGEAEATALCQQMKACSPVSRPSIIFVASWRRARREAPLHGRPPRLMRCFRVDAASRLSAMASEGGEVCDLFVVCFLCYGGALQVRYGRLWAH